MSDEDGWEKQHETPQVEMTQWKLLLFIFSLPVHL